MFKIYWTPKSLLFVGKDLLLNYSIKKIKKQKSKHIWGITTRFYCKIIITIK